MPFMRGSVAESPVERRLNAYLYEGGGVQTTAMPPWPIWRRRDGCVSSAEGDTGAGVKEPSEKIPPMGRFSIS
jgi:hypothetical protein